MQEIALANCTSSYLHGMKLNIKHLMNRISITVMSRNKLTLWLRFGCGSVAVRLRFGRGSVAVRSRFGCGWVEVRSRFGCGWVEVRLRSTAGNRN